jgi:hypothetical protein
MRIKLVAGPAYCSIFSNMYLFNLGIVPKVYSIKNREWKLASMSLNSSHVRQRAAEKRITNRLLASACGHPATFTFFSPSKEHIFPTKSKVDSMVMYWM